METANRVPPAPLAGKGQPFGTLCFEWRVSFMEQMRSGTTAKNKRTKDGMHLKSKGKSHCLLEQHFLMFIKKFKSKNTCTLSSVLWINLLTNLRSLKTC